MRPENCWTSAGFACWSSPTCEAPALRSARGPLELGPREIADYGELIDWVAAHGWSNGRLGAYGTSYEGQAAELVVGLGNPHVVCYRCFVQPA